MTPETPEKSNADWFGPGRENLLLIYGLYLISLAVGVTGLIALIFAYINRNKSDEWIESHYTYIIRTFWIGLLYAVISMVLSMVLIGFVLMLAVVAWFVIRCILGLQKASQRQPIADPQSWLI